MSCCSENKESTCRSYPHCWGCNAHQITMNKENNMKYDDVKIMVGNKVYPATSIDWIQTPGDYPRINVEASVNPYNYSAFSSRYCSHAKPAPLSIVNVIFNAPATIVFWSDGTKTVVKCDYEHEEYDPEKGIAMAVTRKMLGDNKYEYYNIFLHWLKKYEKQPKKDVKNKNTEDWSGDICDA